MIQKKFGFFNLFKNFKLQEKVKIKKIPFYLFFILTGFLIGNLFGLLTKNLSIQVVTINLIVFFEFITYLKYEISGLKRTKINFFNKNSLIILNSIKRGFLIGIFVEAFKVGS